MKKSILMAFAMLFSIYVNAQLPYKITAPKIEVRADSLKLIGNAVVLSDKAGNQIINVNGLDRTAGRVLTTDEKGVGRFAIPPTQINSDWNSATGLSQILNKPVLFSGSYTDLSNKPTIPPTQINSDWNSATGLSQILNKPTLFDGAYNSLSGKPTLATVAASGSYTDLINTPTIPNTIGLATNSSVDTKLVSYVSKIVADTTTALKTLTNGISVTSGSGSILNVNTNGTYIGNVAQTTPTLKSALVTGLTLTNPSTSVVSNSNTNTINLDASATLVPSLIGNLGNLTVHNNSTLSIAASGIVGSVITGHRSAPYTATTIGGRFFVTTSGGASGQPNTQNWTNTALDGGIIGLQGIVSISGGTGVLGTISNASAISGRINTASNNLLITNGQNYASLNNLNIANRITNLRGYVSEEMLGGVNNTNLLLGTGTSPTGNWNIFSSSSYPNNLGTSVTTLGSLNISTNPNTSSSSYDFLVRNPITGAVEKVASNSLIKTFVAPVSATDTGVAGEIRATAEFIYVCIATNTWVRTALATW